MSDLSVINPLTEADRLDARDHARRHVIRRAGPEPRRDQYRHATLSQYPRWLTGLVGAMLAIVFVAAASISTFRLYAAGRDFFMEDLPIPWQAQAVGVATAIMAEFLVITAASAATILFTGRSRALAAIPVAIGLAVAFVGNHEITQAVTLWGWLDTIAPPLAVLSVGVMGERVILLTLRERWANEQAYQAALADWKAATADPESSPDWGQAYATALRDRLRAVNSRGAGKAAREAAMADLTLADWRALVHREIEADHWYAAPAVVDRAAGGSGVIRGPQGGDRHPLATAPALTGGNGNGNGHRHGLSG